MLKKVIPNIHTFTSEKIWQFQYLLEERKYREGTLIAKEGKVGDLPFIVKKGKLGIYISNKSRDIKEWIVSASSPIELAFL